MTEDQWNWQVTQDEQSGEWYVDRWTSEPFARHTDGPYSTQAEAMWRSGMPVPNGKTVDKRSRCQITDELMIGVKMLAVDALDYLTVNDGGFSQDGLRDRFAVLVEEIEELEGM